PVSWMQNRSGFLSLRASRACSLACSSGSISWAIGPATAPAATMANVAETAISSRFMAIPRMLCRCSNGTHAAPWRSRSGPVPAFGVHGGISQAPANRRHICHVSFAPMICFHRFRLPALLSALLLAACATAPSPPPPAGAPAAPYTLLLVSLDGVHPDDLDRGDTPNLSRLAADGVQAEWMVPSYPTLTFPNHYTLVTGLRPN